MQDSIEWLIGAVGTLFTLVGGAIVRDRQVMQTIRDGDEKLSDRCGKIETAYVPKSDMEMYFRRFEQSLDHMQSEQARTNTRIDAVLNALRDK